MTKGAITLVLLVAAISLTSEARAAEDGGTQQDEMFPVYLAKKILTMDRVNSEAVAVAVRGKRVEAIGSEARSRFNGRIPKVTIEVRDTSAGPSS
jgi:hypothetical protein